MEMNYQQRHDVREAIKVMVLPEFRTNEWTNVIIDGFIRLGREEGAHLGRHVLILPDFCLLDKDRNAMEISITEV